MTEMLMNNKIPHNKKRNVGLLYEFFSRYIAKAILESRDEDVKKAKMLVRKHFNKSTDLYKELKLFKTLKETKVSNREAATRLMEKIKILSATQSQKRLDLEKTSLIHEVNQILNDPNFFNQNIQDYKIFGTIQILLNSWRNNEINENISAIFHFEELLIENLLTPKKTDVSQDVVSSDGNVVNRLVVDIMVNKINEQFDSLNDQQKRIITLYTLHEDDADAKKELSSIFESLKTNLNSIVLEEGNQETKQKLDEIKKMINNDYKDFESLTDDTVTFYLGISKLEKELRNG